MKDYSGFNWRKYRHYSNLDEMTDAMFKLEKAVLIAYNEDYEDFFNEYDKTYLFVRKVPNGIGLCKKPLSEVLKFFEVCVSKDEGFIEIDFEYCATTLCPFLAYHEVTPRTAIQYLKQDEGFEYTKPREEIIKEYFQGIDLETGEYIEE